MFMEIFCSLHSGGLNYCSVSLLQDKLVQILEPPRTVAEENSLSGADQTKIFTIFKDIFNMTSSQEKGGKKGNE